jgi:UPF0755 protein
MRKFVFISFILGFLIVGVISFWFYYGIHQPFRGYTGSEKNVEVSRGMGVMAIGRKLAEAGVVRDAYSFCIAVGLSQDRHSLKAGEYKFDQPMTPIQVVEKIEKGDVQVRSITFPEGLTIREMAKIYEKNGFGPASAFIAAANNSDPISDLDHEARDLEGYLFPDTYNLPSNTSPGQLVKLMVNRFKDVFKISLQKPGSQLGLSPRQIVTLASLIEKETGNVEERSLVSAVFLNRLKIGMPLQCDPSVIYALTSNGQYQGKLSHADLSIDSPYNTYRIRGLPSGPIAAPGKAALEAAVHPSNVDYLYFVSRNDGTHEFARNLAEHDRNVQRFQKGSQPVPSLN